VAAVDSAAEMGWGVTAQDRIMEPGALVERQVELEHLELPEVLVALVDWQAALVAQVVLAA